MKRKPAPAHEAVALLVADIALGDDGAAPVEIQLFPAGEFRARDGRPAELSAWRLDESNATTLVAAADERKTDYAIDYEHQSLNTLKNGQPAPAAGWFKSLAWKQGKGLFAAVEWTERAREMIAAREYRFISPVFGYDKATGAVRHLFNAALTNNPALDGMDDVLARAAATYGFSHTPEDEDSDMLSELIEILGLDPKTDSEAALSALRERLQDQPAKREAGKGVASATPDPEKFAPVALVNELRDEVATLRGNQAEREVEDVIQAALTNEAGPKLLDSQLEWARELGRKDLASLKRYIEEAPAIAALAGRQTAGRTSPDGAATKLGESETAVLSALGLTAEQIESIEKEDAK
jgi:phage I-like protein